MNPCPLDGTDQLARHVLAACIEPDGPVDADGDQARVIDDARHPAFLLGGEAHGRGTRPPGRECDDRDAAGARGRGSWPPRSHDPDVAWLINGLSAQSGIEPSGP